MQNSHKQDDAHTRNHYYTDVTHVIVPTELNETIPVTSDDKYLNDVTRTG